MEKKVSDFDLLRLCSDTQKRLKPTKFAAILRTIKFIDILICGKAGCGKSTLVNGLIGVDLMGTWATEGYHCTTQVQKYVAVKDKITVTVWDTPGLMDGTNKQEDYWKDIQDNCPSVHLKLFCVNCNQTRFVTGSNNPDFVVMKQFTDAFGMEFWSNTIIVLTMANTVEAFKPKWKHLKLPDKQREFKLFIEEFTTQIRSILHNDIKLPEGIVKKMKIVPTGHYDDRKLLDRDYWLSDFYFECLDAIPSPEAKGALLNLNLDRFRMKNEVVDSNFTKDAEMQPIVADGNGLVIISETIEKCSMAVESVTPTCNDQMIESCLEDVGSATPNDEPSEGGISTKGAAGIGSGVGGVVGARLGFIGLFGGPLAFATVPAGAAVGTALGAGLGYFTKRMMGSSETEKK